MSRVSEILEHKGGLVLSVNSSETVMDAISLMAEVNIGAVLVLEDEKVLSEALGEKALFFVSRP